MIAQCEKKYIILFGVLSCLFSVSFLFFIQGFSGEVVYYGFFLSWFFFLLPSIFFFIRGFLCFYQFLLRS